MLKNILFIAIIISSFFQLLAGTPDSTTIGFTENTIEFESIYEADGKVAVSFEFINTGSSPLIINRIIAPGFSSFDYTKDSIFPGEKGVIKAIINPFGNKGYFNKSLLVFSNTANSPSNLTVKGKIVSGSITSNFKYNIGPLAVKHLQLNFGYLYKGEEIVRYMPVYNQSKKPIKLSFGDIPSYLSVSKKFEQLNPETIGFIEIIYNTNLIDDWDFIIDKIKLFVEGDSIAEGELMVTANIRENFDLLSENEKLNKPKAFMPRLIYNFDTIPSGRKVKIEFPIYNTGNSDLIIRSVKPTCGCTAVIPLKNIISPGDSTQIMVEFNSLGFTGLNKKGVTIITNDPKNYKQFLWVIGYIE
jgi:hypothetical protein